MTEITNNCNVWKAVMLNENDELVIKYGDEILPADCQFIPTDHFRDNLSLVELVIPEGITEIPENAFSGCRLLRSIAIPASVSEIRKAAFHNCSALETIALPAASPKSAMQFFADVLR